MKKGLLLIIIGVALMGFSAHFMESDDSPTTEPTVESDDNLDNMVSEDEIDGTGSAGTETNGSQSSNEEQNIEIIEETVYSDDSRTNNVIIRYNKNNPDAPVKLNMVENWETGDGIATRVTFDDFCIQFGHNEGEPSYALWSDEDNNEENKTAFINESLNWFKAIYGYEEDWEMDRIRKPLSDDSSEITFDITTKSNLTYQENGWDYYMKHHKYVIRISPKAW